MIYTIRNCINCTAWTGHPHDRRRRVLAGEDAPRSRAHYVYVGLELVKVAALLATGIFLLAR